MNQLWQPREIVNCSKLSTEWKILLPNQFCPITVMKGKRNKRQWCSSKIPQYVNRKVETGKVGTIAKEYLLEIAFININGLNLQSSCDVQTFLNSHSPHVFCVLETKKNSAQTVDTVNFQNYVLGTEGLSAPMSNLVPNGGVILCAQWAKAIGN